MSKLALFSLCFCSILLTLPLHLAAEQLTTVAVVDVERVFSNFYRESQQLRSFNQLKEEYQKEINEYMRRLASLQEELVRLVDSSNTIRKTQLESDIESLTTYIDSLVRQRQEDLDDRRSSLMSDEFVQNLQQAIRYVSETEGYTIVLRADDAGLQWWSAEVDISEKVIEHLFRIHSDS